MLIEGIFVLILFLVIGAVLAYGSRRHTALSIKPRVWSPEDEGRN